MKKYFLIGVCSPVERKVALNIKVGCAKVIAFLILISSTNAQSASVDHSHGGRHHTHSLPAQGVNHKHGNSAVGLIAGKQSRISTSQAKLTISQIEKLIKKEVSFKGSFRHVKGDFHNRTFNDRLYFVHVLNRYDGKFFGCRSCGRYIYFPHIRKNAYLIDYEKKSNNILEFSAKKEEGMILLEGKKYLTFDAGGMGALVNAQNNKDIILLISRGRGRKWSDVAGSQYKRDVRLSMIDNNYNKYANNNNNSSQASNNSNQKRGNTPLDNLSPEVDKAIVSGIFALGKWIYGGGGSSGSSSYSSNSSSSSYSSEPSSSSNSSSSSSSSNNNSSSSEKPTKGVKKIYVGSRQNGTEQYVIECHSGSSHSSINKGSNSQKQSDGFWYSYSSNMGTDYKNLSIEQVASKKCR